MAVLMIAEVAGLTEDVYAGMVSGMTPGMRVVQGFSLPCWRAEPLRGMARGRSVGDAGGQ